DHPCPVDVPKIHISLCPHVQCLTLDRVPDPVEAEAEALLFDGQGHTPDGADPPLACLHHLGCSACSPHDIHHVRSQGGEIEMHVYALIRSGCGTFYPG